MITKYRIITILFLGILLAGCNASSKPEVPASKPTEMATAVIAAADPTSVASSTPLPSPTLPPTDPAPATATTLPTSTATTEATATAEPTETAVITATMGTLTGTMGTSTPAVTGSPTAVSGSPTAPAATNPPPPPGNIQQPPYAPSPCSEHYPCNNNVAGWEARIQVLAGFTDSYFAHINGNPTSVTFGPDGSLYVAVHQGSIYKVDSAGNISFYVGGFNTPTGLAFRPGTSDLYVASRVRNEIIGGESQISIVQGGGARQIIGGLPCCYVDMHAANGIAFGPDGLGYVGVGARADHGEVFGDLSRQDELHPFEASILRFSPDGGFVEAYAKGFRNPYDIAFDANGQLYATDNAPDYGPPDELHRVVQGGQHGYPWYDCDVCFHAPPDVQVIQPIYQFIPHASPTGITAYLADQFPGYYNSLFVTLWSGFPGAQKVMKFGPGGAGATNFAMGFALPIDVTVGPEGSLYVADYATGIIFKISYTG